MTSRETILPLQALARNGNQQRIIDWISAQPRLQVLSVLALSITPWDILPPVKFWNWAAWKNKTRIIDRFINDIPLSYYCSNLVEDESNANTFHYAANHLGVLGRLLDHFYANMADETMLRGCLQSITSFDDTPFTIVLHHLIQEQRGLENSTEADDYDPYEEEQQLIDHYNQVADFLSSRRGGRFLSISMVGSGLNHKDMYEGYRGDIRRFLEDQYDQLSDNRISDMIYNKLDSLDYYSEEEEEEEEEEEGRWTDEEEEEEEDPILPIPQTLRERVDNALINRNQEGLISLLGENENIIYAQWDSNDNYYFNEFIEEGMIMVVNHIMTNILVAEYKLARVFDGTFTRNGMTPLHYAARSILPIPLWTILYEPLRVFSGGALFQLGLGLGQQTPLMMLLQKILDVYDDGDGDDLEVADEYESIRDFLMDDDEGQYYVRESCDMEHLEQNTAIMYNKYERIIGVLDTIEEENEEIDGTQHLSDFLQANLTRPTNRNLADELQATGPNVLTDRNGDGLQYWKSNWDLYPSFIYEKSGLVRIGDRVDSTDGALPHGRKWYVERLATPEDENIDSYILTSHQRWIADARFPVVVFRGEIDEWTVDGPLEKTIYCRATTLGMQKWNYAEIGVYYTLDQFRKLDPPKSHHDKFTFHVLEEEIDCDIGDYETTKFMPVKIAVTRPPGKVADGKWVSRHYWDKDGTGKLFLFCANELKEYLNTHKGTYGLSVDNADQYFEDDDFLDTNPFTKKKILGVQYLTQEEINKEELIYVKLREEEEKNKENKRKSEEARKKSEEASNKSAYRDALKTLADTPMLVMLRRRLAAARTLLAEEEAKDPRTLTSRERSSRTDEIVGARNRITMLEAMIKREEEKRKRKSPEESEGSEGSASKRQRRELYLKLASLKF